MFKKILTKKILLSLIFVSVLGVGMLGMGGDAFAAEVPTGPVPPVEFKNPLGADKDSFPKVLEAAFNVLQTVIVTFAMIFIVIAAILYITSAGNESRMTAAKAAFTAALIGMAIGIAAPSFLSEIWRATGADTRGVVPDPKGIPLSEIALNVLNFLLGIVGTLAIIFLVIGGIMMLMSRGDETRAESAKKIITYAIIGIAVALGSLLIVRLIGSLFA